MDGISLFIPKDLKFNMTTRGDVFLQDQLIISKGISGFALSDFLDGMKDEFQIVEVGGPSLNVSLDRLPSRPTIMVLRPRYLNVTE